MENSNKYRKMHAMNEKFNKEIIKMNQSEILALKPSVNRKNIIESFQHRIDHLK